MHRSCSTSSLNSCSSLTLGAIISSMSHTSYVLSKAVIPNKPSGFPIVGPSRPRDFGFTTADMVSISVRLTKNERFNWFPVFNERGERMKIPRIRIAHLHSLGTRTQFRANNDPESHLSHYHHSLQSKHSTSLALSASHQNIQGNPRKCG